jgi:hypothetical protein
MCFQVDLSRVCLRLAFAFLSILDINIQHLFQISLSSTTRKRRTMGGRDSTPPAMITFLVLNTVVIILRTYVRICKQTLGYDDVALYISFVGILPTTAETPFSKR